MLKYFYYIWNLLLKDEKRELFYHFGQCLLAAIIYTIIDWNYLIILWAMTQATLSNIFYIVMAVQAFSLVMGFWYYYVKYRIMTTQNYFYKILSGRHYNYILSRIANNASYKWINDKSVIDLTRQIDSTDKGLQNIFTFMTQFVRLISVIIFSIFIISWNYSFCLPVFSIVSVLIYYFSKRNINFAFMKAKRNNFKKTNQTNSIIISENISLVFDSIIHGDFDKIITNIITLNNTIKNDQIKMYAHENRIYIKIGLLLITSYILMVAFVAYWLQLPMKEFVIFFIAALLTYKCIHHNINELLDMYTDIRQTELDFELLDDIWDATSTKRMTFKSFDLPLHELDFEEMDEYHKFRFNKIDKQKIRRFESFFDTFNLWEKFGDDNVSDIKLLRKMNKFVTNDSDILDKYLSFINDCDIIIPPEIIIYEKFIDAQNKQNDQNKQNINKNNKKLFQLSLHSLEFRYPCYNADKLFKLTYESNNNKSIELDSSSHVLIDGISGSGKTTLLKLIRGIIPFCNKLQLDLKVKEELHNIVWSNIASSISYCQQNSYSFNGGTIYQILSDNFVTSPNNKNNSDCLLMDKALTVSCVDEKFKNLDYICTNKTISGGQIQRLTIAKNLYRIFKKDKNIIILDEIDAGLDHETAERIIINLLLLFKNRLLFIVLHTDKLKSLFKKRIMIDNGRINYLNYCENNDIDQH